VADFASVDRQTKGSYATYEGAEKAGLVIKKEHPMLQVAVYDGVEGVNKIIELPFRLRPQQLRHKPLGTLALKFRLVTGEGRF
jgi:hypothetical protein